MSIRTPWIFPWSMPSGQTMTVRGESLGGGKELDRADQSGKGGFPPVNTAAVIVIHLDRPGVVAHITKVSK